MVPQTISETPSTDHESRLATLSTRTWRHGLHRTSASSYDAHQSSAPMVSNRRPTKLRVDSDGVKMETSGVRPSVWLVAVALALTGAFLLLRPGGQRQAGERLAAPAGQSAPNLAAIAQAGPPVTKSQHAQTAARAPLHPGIRLVPKPPSEPVPPVEPAQSPPNEENPAATDMGEDQLTGIALFPPPGTKPILRGFVVPDNFEVPEGYVRHYQTTDRGHQLPPILMFHPDYQLVDEHGQPIPMPKDRVVPPELLPPGMPTQKLEVPEEPPEEAPENPDAQDARP